MLISVYCITSVEQHQAATNDFGCSREVLFLIGSFSMVNVTARGCRSREVSLVRGATHGGYTVVLVQIVV